MGSGWSMGGSIGGWVNESTFAGAVLSNDLDPNMGGRLFGTGAGFNTWINRSDQPSSGVSLGAGLPRTIPFPQPRESFSNLDEQIAFLTESGILGQGSGSQTSPYQTQEMPVVVQGPPVPRPPVPLRPCW